MNGKILKLFTLFVALLGFALAESETQAPESTSVANTAEAKATTTNPTEKMDKVDTKEKTSEDKEAKSTEMSESDAESTDSTTSDESKTMSSNSTMTHAHERTITSHATIMMPTGEPTTTIPRMDNAARRPSQPELTKLTIVVGLVTYGLILF